MKTLVTLSAPLVLVLLLGCGGSGGPPAPGGIPENLEVTFIGAPFCCDPNAPFPQEIGTLRVSHVGAANSPDITVTLGDFSETAVKPEAGIASTVKLEYGDVLDTKLYAWACDWDVASTLLSSESVYGLNQVRLVLNNGCGPLHGAFAITELLIPTENPALSLGDSVNIAIIGALVNWSSAAVDPSIPFYLWSEINRYGVMRRSLLLARILQAFGVGSVFKPGDGSTAIEAADFPCGAGPNGYTVCPLLPATMAEGDHFLAYLSTEDDIPLSSTRLITYGFVFDSDGDPSNNYVPHPSFPDDYFKDTDRWYTLDYDPVGGWTLVCRDATNSVITEVPTAARAIIRDNSIVLVVPSSEFASSQPGYRVTAFTHTGDYGANPPHDWSGDQHPRVFEDLAPFVRQD